MPLSPTDLAAALSLVDKATYIELKDGAAGTVSQVHVNEEGEVELVLLVTVTGDRGGDQFWEETRSPTRTYTKAKLSEVQFAKRPPN